MRQIWRVVGCLLAMAIAGLGQGDHGTITGTVQDLAKAVVPNAAVTATNTETGAVYPTVTTSTGNFTVASLPAGSYDLSVEAPGFRKYIGRNIRVQVTQVMRLDVSLEVGATTESITVEGAVRQLKSESVEQSMNVSGNRINALPLNFGGGGGGIGALRAPLTFVVLSPGVAGSGTTGRVNGQAPNTYRVFVDGQDTTTAGFGRIDASSVSGQRNGQIVARVEWLTLAALAFTVAVHQAQRNEGVWLAEHLFCGRSEAGGPLGTT